MIGYQKTLLQNPCKLLKNVVLLFIIGIFINVDVSSILN